MKDISPTLFLEINNTYFNFFVCMYDDQDNLSIIHNSEVPIIGIEDNRISDYEKILSVIKENIYLIENKLNYTFKNIVLILENFNLSFINLSGYKKLNGSQILRENITYILNTLRSYVDKIESQKTAIHIFNSKFCLDNKKVENLPIGLFGDFYSHELSLSLINTNDLKNLKNIFENCNLKIKKTLLKSFVKGAHISESYKNIDTFFLIKIDNDKSKIFYFENNSLKFEQNFKFGLDIILRDISKITLLNKETIKLIISNIELNDTIPDNELIEEEFFANENFRKIKKKLIYDIALSRIIEISELIIFNNSNLSYYQKKSKSIFLEINSNSKIENIKNIFKNVLSMRDKFEIKTVNDLSSEKILKTLEKLVHFGWKTEAIPVSLSKKTLISRFFEALFG